MALSIPAPATAAAKAGAKCQKVGVQSVVGTKTFTCIKSGKKLIWLESNNKQSLPTQQILALTINLLLQVEVIQELLPNGRQWRGNISATE
jgi:hypothetical protein